MTTSDRKTKLAQLILFNSILIFGSQSIVAAPAPQLAKGKKVVVELTIGEILANERIEVPISRYGGPLGGGAMMCPHCNNSTPIYSYSLSASRHKKSGVIVHFTLHTTFEDGRKTTIEKDILVPRKN